MNDFRSILLAGCSIVGIIGGYAGIAHAQAPQTPQASAEPDTIETVVVTARKKSENLLTVPIAVQALTGKDIETRDIQTLTDVSLFTPGLTIDQALTGSARNDRSFQVPIIRGMNPGDGVAAPTTAVFVNGVFVPASLVQNLLDVDNVEILEGPQSAYFGRDTFAGAINIVTATPPKELGGYVNVEEGTRRTEDYRISVGGPILGEKLSFLANIGFTSHFGSYKNAEYPNEYLGSQSTLNGSLTIVAKPIDNLKIKFFGQMLTDMDGPAATGVLLADQTGTIPSQSNCTVAGQPWFCGTLPGQPSTSPAQSDHMTSGIAAYLAQPGQLIPPGSSVKGYGLYRKSYDATLNVDYVIPSLGLTLSSLSGFAYDAVSELSDLSNLDANATGTVYGSYPYTGFPYLVQNVAKDYSQEFRLSSDQSKPLRGTLGVSYVQSRVEQGGGAAGYGVYPGSYSEAAPSAVITRGVFFSVAYDVLSNLTLDFDGRYQSDAVTGYQAANQYVPYTEFVGHYHNFLPRATIQYKFARDLMAYFTYSEGVNTSEQINYYTNLPLVDQNFISKSIDATPLLSPERLKNYELGFKGKFLDGRASLSADIYYDIWTNQIQANNFIIPYPANNGLIDPTAPANDLITAFSNTGKSIAKGLEVNGQIIPIEHWSVNFAGAINDTKYQSGGICSACASYPSYKTYNGELVAVTPSADGNYLPNAPKYSATIGIQYSHPTQFLSARDWYARVDYSYRSGFYIEELNIEKTQDQHVVNIRSGINWRQWRLEGYVNNLLNEKAYTSAFADVNFANFPDASVRSNNAVYVGLPQLITVGGRLKYIF